MTNAERRQRIDATLSEIGDVFVIPESGGARMAGRVAYFHLVHLRDLFDGVALLLAQARAHGAFVLGRSMFEVSVMLGALEKPKTRDAIAARWFHDAQADAQKLISAYAAAAQDVTRMREILRENDRKADGRSQGARAHKASGVVQRRQRGGASETERGPSELRHGARIHPRRLSRAEVARDA